MAKSHYTADSAFRPRLMIVLRLPGVAAPNPVAASPGGVVSAGNTFPTPRSFIA
jgi:hypothetical protein